MPINLKLSLLFILAAGYHAGLNSMDIRAHTATRRVHSIAERRGEAAAAAMIRADPRLAAAQPILTILARRSLATTGTLGPVAHWCSVRPKI